MRLLGRFLALAPPPPTFSKENPGELKSRAAQQGR